MADWQAIKTEYITTDTSYRKLAQKYDIHYKVISDRGKKEGWVELRSQHRAKTLTDTLDKISEKESERAARIHSVADMLLTEIENMVENVATVKELRALTAALKDLKEVQGVKSNLDTREQEARIANLRRQAEAEEQKDTPKLIVEGLPEEFKI